MPNCMKLVLARAKFDESSSDVSYSKKRRLVSHSEGVCSLGNVLHHLCSIQFSFSFLFLLRSFCSLWTITRGEGGMGSREYSFPTLCPGYASLLQKLSTRCSGSATRTP